MEPILVCKKYLLLNYVEFDFFLKTSDWIFVLKIDKISMNREMHRSEYSAHWVTTQQVVTFIFIEIFLSNILKISDLIWVYYK